MKKLFVIALTLILLVFILMATKYVVDINQAAREADNNAVQYGH